ncbi:MAG: hypothetical protein PVI22_13430, partial [Lysobacterales bacterium]
ANHRISQYTSIGRPLDARSASGRAVLAGVVLAAIVGGALALHNGEGAGFASQQALVFLLAVFATWALARELDPDDPSAAFIAMAVGLATVLAAPSPGLFVAFTTLGLMRIVNRSSGLAARKIDSLLLVVLSVAVMYLSDSPFFGLVAALAFILDGSLREPLRHQWVFGLVGIGATVVYMVDHDVGLAYFSAPRSLIEWLVLLCVLLLGLDALLLGEVKARGDFTGRRLDRGRVRGAVAVALAAALQGLNRPGQLAVIIAAIAGICIAVALRKGFRSPAA